MQRFKKHSNNVHQMSSFQKNDPLSIQCEFEVTNVDGESPSSDDEDQDEDDKLMKI